MRWPTHHNYPVPRSRNFEYEGRRCCLIPGPLQSYPDAIVAVNLHVVFLKAAYYETGQAEVAVHHSQ